MTTNTPSTTLHSDDRLARPSGSLPDPPVAGDEVTSRVVSPEDRRLIESDAARLESRSDRFTTEFYATLFELDPALRPLFPDDVTDQRRKLLEELSVLVARAVGCERPSDVDAFVHRARDLGERHELYGVEAPMYELVGVALVAALAHVIDDFDEGHADAWRRLYRLVAGTMQAG